MANRSALEWRRAHSTHRALRRARWVPDAGQSPRRAAAWIAEGTPARDPRGRRGAPPPASPVGDARERREASATGPERANESTNARNRSKVGRRDARLGYHEIQLLLDGQHEADHVERAQTGKTEI